MDRKHLRAEHNIITDDVSVSTYPVQKVHIREIDNNRNSQFTRGEGDRAAVLDKKLGIDYDLYNALNMQAQRATLKCMDTSRKINATIPNMASGLGSVNAMNQKLQNSSVIQSSDLGSFN